MIEIKCMLAGMFGLAFLIKPSARHVEFDLIIGPIVFVLGIGLPNEHS